MNRKYCNILLVSIAIFTFLLLAGCVEKQSRGAISATSGQPVGKSASEMTAGLKVRFFDKKFYNLEQMPTGSQLETFGRAGNPVNEINNQFGKKGNVFGSGRSQNVGIYFSGMINLRQVGPYSFQALSNDGVRCFIENQMVFEDPFVHGDRLTPVGTYNAESPGWYSLKLVYFQKKGSATLKFYWKPPGATKFEIVPASVLAHNLN